jgi:hypothetical protein
MLSPLLTGPASEQSPECLSRGNRGSVPPALYRATVEEHREALARELLGGAAFVEAAAVAGRWLFQGLANLDPLQRLLDGD